MELRGSELAALLDTPEELRHLWFNVDEDGNKRFKPFKTPTFRKVLAEVGKADTDAYVKLSKTLSDVGLNAAYLEGETVGLSDLAPPIDTAPFFEKMDAALAQVSKDLPRDQQIATRNKIHSATLDKIHEAVMEAAGKSGNSLHRIVTSGARGNPAQFRAMVSSPGTYVDYKGRQLPIFVRKGFNEGVDPVDYLASSFGTRSSIISIKSATAKGGDIAKQLQNVAARMVVREKDCGVANGIALNPEDDSLYHRVLAKKTGEYDAGTVVTDKIANDLRAAGKPVQVRSPLTCSTPNGLCSKCAGAGPSGDLRPIGFHAGSTAASSVGEPLAQGALCLAAGTPVRMADGSVKKIEDIVVGDRVLSVSLGEFVTPVKVLNTFDNGIRDVREFTFSTKKGVTAKITCTPDHNILCRCKIKEAGASSAGKKNRIMPIGTRSTNFSAVCQHNKDFRLLPRNYSKSKGKCRTYDIEVDHPNHLFLLANGLVVSNSAKHLGGMGGEKKKFTGIGVVAQLLQSPENFPDRAAVAKASGRVKAIEKAPQGGNYIIDDTDNRLYVEPGLNINVAPGDEIDAGDVLSDGLVDTEDVVAAAGLGAGRAAMVEQLGRVLADSNAKTDRRHLEVLSRASINFLENTGNETRGGYLPGDVLTYDDWRKDYSPPASMRLEDPEKAVGKYLEEPALHYTLKTPITRRVASDLKRAGMDRVAVSDDRGDIEPGFLRLRTPYASEEDWIVAQTGSYLKSRMANAVTRGADSIIEGNDHYAPALARGQYFGKTTENTGKF